MTYRRLRSGPREYAILMTSRRLDGEAVPAYSETLEPRAKLARFPAPERGMSRPGRPVGVLHRTSLAFRVVSCLTCRRFMRSYTFDAPN